MSTRAKSFGYDLDLTWDGERRSTLSAGGRPAIAGAPPEEFPHGDPSRWSPEHLYLASIASCTMISFLAHAEHHDLEVRSFRAGASGTVTRRAEDGRYAFVEVRLRPEVQMAPGHAEAARGLTGKAERDCFISASTSADVRTDWSITEA